MPGLSVDARELLKKFKQVTNALRAKVDAAVESVAKETRGRIAHDYWRNRTGYTDKRTRVEKLGRAHYRVAVRVPWAEVLEKGSRPHVIEPEANRARNASLANAKAKAHGKTKRLGAALGPMLGGKFFRRVHHPGTRGFHFARKEAERARVLLAVRVADAFRAAGK